MDLDPEERAHKGVFLSFQYPIEIPGISVSNFIKTSLQKKERLGSRSIPKRFIKNDGEKMELLSIKKGYLSRNMNEGFSGGREKRNEIFQMACWNLNYLF